MQQTLMQQGVELMLFGMGTVFVFLALLIIATTIMSAVLRHFVPPEPAVMPPTRQVAGNDQQLIAVITAAIHKHRSRKK